MGFRIIIILTTLSNILHKANVLITKKASSFIGPIVAFPTSIHLSHDRSKVGHHEPEETRPSLRELD